MGSGKHGPFAIHYDGLFVSLRSESTHTHSQNIKSMLVSHNFVDLLRMIMDDDSFSKPLFEQLTEAERDFMRYLLKRTKTESRDFQSAYNATINHLVDRLKLLQEAISIGDDNPSLKSESTALVKRLYEKGVLSGPLYTSMRRFLGIR